jgi:mRNA interferase RelE/StbE
MPFDLAFHPEALREWQQLTAGIREQFKNQLAERLNEPRIPASKLRSSSNRYKIKLRAAGFWLVYEVQDHEVLFIDRPISAESHDLLPTPSPLSWINYPGNPTPMTKCLQLLDAITRSGSRSAAPSRSAFHRAPWQTRRCWMLMRLEQAPRRSQTRDS